MSLDGSKRETYRARHRRERRQEFLDVALRTVATGGVAALTMRSITDELKCSEGSIYSYFPSKGALIAEVQRESLMTVGRSLLLSQSYLDSVLVGRTEPVATLARVVAASRFWVAAETMFPREIEMSRMLFGTPGEVVADDEGETALQPALTLIDFGSGLLDAATAAGALSPGDSFERATVILAGSTGVMLGGAFARWEQRITDARGFADRMLTDLFVGWGAPRSLLAEVDEIIGELARTGRLVPRVD